MQDDDGNKFNEFLDVFLYNHGIFPEEPLQDTIDHFEHYKTLLLLVLKVVEEACKEDLRELVGHYYAMYILAQMREESAYPLICDLLALPGDDLVLIFSARAFEHMPAILASVYDGDSDLMYQLIIDPDVDALSKIVCIYAFERLYHAKKIDKEELVRIFRDLFDILHTSDEAVEAMVALLETVRNLRLQEVVDVIRTALQHGIAYNDSFTLEEFEEVFQIPVKEPKEPLLVDDAIDLLRQLECFSYLDVIDGFTDEERELWGDDIEELTYNPEPPPIDVLNRLIARPNEAKVLLHRIIDYALVKYSSIEFEEMPVLYAMYLLAQFRDTTTQSKMRDLIELVDFEEEEFSSLTKTLLRDGHRLLVSLYDGDLEFLLDMMKDPAGDIFARHIALRALCLLCHQQKIDRPEFIKNVHLQIEFLEIEESRSLLALLVLEMLHLRLHEVFDRLGASFKKGAVDEELVSLKQFEDTIAHGQCMYEDCHVINDIFEEIPTWGAFEEVKPRVALQTAGRNDPCPCGSGKKYKKCCW